MMNNYYFAFNEEKSLTFLAKGRAFEQAFNDDFEMLKKIYISLKELLNNYRLTLSSYIIDMEKKKNKAQAVQNHLNSQLQQLKKQYQTAPNPPSYPDISSLSEEERSLALAQYEKSFNAFQKQITQINKNNDELKIKEEMLKQNLNDVISKTLLLEKNLNELKSKRQRLQILLAETESKKLNYETKLSIEKRKIQAFNLALEKSYERGKDALLAKIVGDDAFYALRQKFMINPAKSQKICEQITYHQNSFQEDVIAHNLEELQKLRLMRKNIIKIAAYNYESMGGNEFFSTMDDYKIRLYQDSIIGIDGYIVLELKK